MNLPQIKPRVDEVTGRGGEREKGDGRRGLVFN